MTAIPLDKLGFGWRSHWAALWWLGLMYRKPKSFETPLKELGRWRATACGVKLYLHAVPWIFAFSMLSRLFLHGVLGLPSDVQATETLDLVTGHLVQLAFGIDFGIAVLRVYYHLPHVFLVWPKPQVRWYRFHPVAWDDMCSVPFPGLERLLVAYAEAFPDAGEREIKRLIEEYPSQRGPALKARTMILARQCGRLSRLTEIPELASRLPEGARGYLAQTRRVLMQTESTLPGEWEYVLGFRRRDTQEPPADETLYTSLRRRLLVVDEGGQWRVRVPLMQRWLRQRA